MSRLSFSHFWSRLLRVVVVLLLPPLFAVAQEKPVEQHSVASLDEEILQIERLLDSIEEVPSWGRDALNFRIDGRILAFHSDLEDLAEAMAKKDARDRGDSGGSLGLVNWLDKALALSTARVQAVSARLDEASEEFDEFDVSPKAIISRAFVQDLRELRLSHLRAIDDQLAQRPALGLPDAIETRAQIQDMLTMAGERLVGQIRLDSMTLAELRQRIVVDPTQEGLKTAVGAVERKQSANLDTLRTLIGLLDDLNMETAEFRALQAQQSGLLGTEILDGAVFLNVLQERLASIRETLVVDAPSILLRFLAFLLVLGLAWLLARLVRSLVYHITTRQSVELGELRERTLVSMSFATVLLFGIVVALSTLGVSLLPMLAGLGIASVIVGFALQESLGNLASGGMILATRPFDMNDHVRIGGVDGKVVDMNLIATTIAGSDNTIHVIPNRQVWNATVLNFTRADSRRIDLEISVPHNANLQDVEQLLQSIVDADSRVRPDPAPNIHFGDESESAITFWVRVWARTTDYDSVLTALKREISEGLRDAGIHTPYPRLQLTVNSSTDADIAHSG